MNDLFRLERGSTALLISMPHVGTVLPDALRERLVPRALACEDTDWHLEALYGDIARSLGASLIVPRHSRYLIDLNRPPEDAPMYPGAHNTELCPSRFFTGEPLYLPGCEPDDAERQWRCETYWQPYHDALGAELARLRAIHGRVVLFDAHSIRSRLPWLFEGRLPDLNLGTASGKACDAGLREGLTSVLAGQTERDWVVDGRFKGGYITRHYGRPDLSQHALQLEMCQSCYMEESPPFAYSARLSAGIQPLLRRLLEAALAWVAHA